MQLLTILRDALHVRRFRREIELYARGQEVEASLSSAEVELFFMPGVGAPDAPILMTRGQALFTGVSIMTSIAILFYLMFHLSPPLW